MDQLAKLISSHVFGGIPFVPKETDEDYDLGTLSLANDFIGIQADLVGRGGAYTIEIGTRPSASIAEVSDVCDLSAMLRQRLNSLSGITVMEKGFG
jgi:hypothetical protein